MKRAAAKASALFLFLVLCSNAAAADPTRNYGVDIAANNAMATAATGHARLRFNSGTGLLELSIATGAYSGLMDLASAQSIGGVKSFADQTVRIMNPAGTSGGVLATTATTARVYTFPDSTTTIVGTVSTQTLTNKTLTAPVLGGSVTGTYSLAGTPTLATSIAVGTTATFGIGDTTHLLTAVAVAKLIGGATNTTGHVVPNVADDTVVLLAATQTLSNKTITAPVLSGTATGTYTLGGTPTLSSPTLAGTSAITFAKANRLGNNSAAPAIAVGAAAQLGTGPAATMAGGDVGGRITLTTGTAPTIFVANTDVNIGVVTFNTTFSVAPNAGVISPCNSVAARIATGVNGIAVFFDRATFSTTQVTAKLVSTGAPTLAASTAYDFCYVWVQ